MRNVDGMLILRRSLREWNGDDHGVLEVGKGEWHFPPPEQSHLSAAMSSSQYMPWMETIFAVILSPGDSVSRALASFTGYRHGHRVHESWNGFVIHGEALASLVDRDDPAFEVEPLRLRLGRCGCRGRL